MNELDLRVRAMRLEADDVMSLELEPATGGPLPAWEPGAHVAVAAGHLGERQYSLCGELGAATWRLAVLREPHGSGGSAWVHDEVRVGDVLHVRGPSNAFALEAADSYAFIAGGIGITPILPMVRRVARAGGRWRLLYGGRRRSSMAFLDELAALGGDVAICPQDELGHLDVDAFLAGDPGAAVYCCGPAPLLEAIAERCAERLLHLERFTPVMDTDAARTGDAFEVRLQRSGVTVAVPDGVSILEAIEAAGLHPPCSCMEGTCGTCETPVLEGEVDHRDGILSDAEREAGRSMMICVSRARSAHLVLDL